MVKRIRAAGISGTVKWKRDEVIAGVLATVLAAAETWRATDQLRSLQAASRSVGSGYAPGGGGQTGDDVGPCSRRDQAQLAAQAILDRADFSTAAKSSTLHGEMDELLMMTSRRLSRAAAFIRGAAAQRGVAAGRK